MKMRMKMRRIAAAVAAVILSTASAAYAANFCALFGGAQVVGSGLILPASGTCAAFNGFYSSGTGLLAGDVCRSSNGTTFLFNLFTQYKGVPDSLAGTWVASSGKGSGLECFTSPCLSFNVTVKKCPATVTIPANLSRFELEAPPPSQAAGDPDSP
jgi:hypothetical protein